MYFSCPSIRVSVLIMWMFQLSAGDDSTITVRIRENIAVGSFICDLFDTIVPRPSRHTTFSMMLNRYFTVRGNKDVVVIGDIDRDRDEELCSERSVEYSCVWKSILMSTDSVHFVLRIIIDDENDSTPQWGVNTMTIDITEGVPPGQFQLELPKAKDPDESPNNTALYAIDPPSKYVYVLNTTTTSGLTPFLKLKQPIDREILPWHNVTVVAMDGGQPQRTGSMMLIIRIIDINDNDPVFHSSIYRHSLQRHMKPNDTIDLYISATDADQGDNGRITYGLSLNAPFAIKNCLDVCPNTAVIIVKKPLLGECHLAEYRVPITASDHGDPVRVSKTMVILTFDSRNRFPPDIQMSNEEPNIYLFENNPVGLNLRTVAVNDRDDGRNGEFRCYLQGNNTAKLRTVSPDNGLRGMKVIQIVASGVFDREQESDIYVTLTCKDLGERPLSSSKNFHIRILDLNDNRPNFGEPFYHFKTYEENESYQKLAQLIAYDEDEGQNSFLTYHINSTSINNITSMLSVDNNGYIVALQRLDREEFPNGFNFSVVAKDHGHPAMSGVTQVYLELLDLNDHSPVFKSSYYNFSFLEDIGNIHSSRMVGHVSACDRDLDYNGLVTYKMATTPPIPFKLHPESGEIISSSLVDREARPTQYVFNVLALDSPSNQLYRRSALATVTIDVVDYNDNKPMFLFPNNDNYRVQLSYLSSIGTVVTTVKATDRDTGLNGEIVYSIVDPDRNILFAVNSSSGEVTLSTVLNSIHEGLENLFIRARDRGSPSLTTLQRLVIDIGEYKHLVIDNPEGPLSANSDSFLTDQATYIVVAIVLGTFFICCGLVAAICTMIYRQWLAARDRESTSHQYQVNEGEPGLLQMDIDNYLQMKEII